ncbi:dihydrofolate reductase family protein [Williamsia deligens]|uniref:Dihydrofolate reductase family protein n=1 Tax=Williamsia deligens TaxID=321325 RepID=A0ABW3G4M9_9NOCA|nr:dihydrofolate reductase family protein [Williamsia deligens]MCP2194737.1 Dihydrofolate reductase [Williamsia deligens]
MAVDYTVDLFSTLDGFAAPAPGTWGGYWGKDSEEWLAHRTAGFSEPSRMVFGANTYRLFLHFQTIGVEPDTWVARMLGSPTTVVSTSLSAPLDWPDAELVAADAVDVVARMKDESDLPLRSHGSVSMNRALLAAGLVDRLHLTIFPVVTGQTGDDPIYRGGPDLDLDLLESRSFAGGIQELIYRPTVHR